MRTLKFLIPVLLLLLSYNYSLAQDVIVDSASNEIVEDTETNEEDDYYVSDTTLNYTGKYVSKDSIEKLKESKQFAYAKNLDSLLQALQQQQQNVQINFKPRKETWLEKFFRSPITKWIFWILAAAFVLFIVYKLFFTKGIFQRRIVKSNVVSSQEEEELSMDGDYNKLIAQSIADKNYRLAVRYLYLQSLQKLALSGAIIFASDKTNYQYVREVSGKTYRDMFATLTLNYEYVWYGEFDIDETRFIKLQTEFKQFYNRI